MMSETTNRIINVIIFVSVSLAIGMCIWSFGFVLGSKYGRLYEKCLHAGGEIISDGTCGHENVVHIDAGSL